MGAGNWQRSAWGQLPLVTLGFLGSSAKVQGFEAVGAGEWMLSSGRSGTV